MSEGELEHIILLITKGTSWPGVFVLPFPFMVIQLCSLLHQSNSDVCQQPERVPLDAFPRHKHTGNVESFGSVYAVKSLFVQKWVQVSSRTFAISGSSG